MTFKLRLTGLAVLALLSLTAPAMSQDEAAPPPPETELAPVTPPAEASPSPGGGPVVAELFTSQACVFCPQADRLFASLAAQPEIIALSCHIDYFDVRRGRLSHRFCTDRQGWYGKVLASGPNYTPQMVVQGHFDVMGYKMEEIGDAIRKAGELKTLPVAIESAETSGHYTLSLPEGAALPTANNTVWLAVYDAPHEVTISGGRNRGQAMTYYNVISDLKDLGAWKAPMDADVALKQGQKGFAVLVQDKKSGDILAAGRYEPDAPAQAPPQSQP